MRANALASVFAVAFAGLTLARPAHAEPTFPGKLQAAAQMSCTPTCTLCHTDPAGGTEHLRSQNYGPLVLAAATGKPDSLSVDTDGDGVSDLEELKAGQDPLSAANGSICSPLYGCFARVAHVPPSGPSTPGLMLAAAVAAMLVRRRTRRSS